MQPEGLVESPKAKRNSKAVWYLQKC